MPEPPQFVGQIVHTPKNLFANSLLALIACVVLAWGDGPAWTGAGAGSAGTRVVQTLTLGGDELRADEPDGRFYFVETRTIAPPVAVERVLRDYDRSRVALHSLVHSANLNHLRRLACSGVSGTIPPNGATALYKLHAVYRL